jgi:hypothetical protein
LALAMVSKGVVITLGEYLMVSHWHSIGAAFGFYMVSGGVGGSQGTGVMRQTL